MSDTPALTAHTETFNFEVELTLQGGTIAQFETDFHNFEWHIPHFVHFKDPASGLGAHLALEFFRTTLRDHSGDIARLMASGILELHDDPNHPVNLGVSAAADVRLLQFQGASMFVGMQATVTADPYGHEASISVAPTISFSFGGTTAGH